MKVTAVRRASDVGVRTPGPDEEGQKYLLVRSAIDGAVCVGGWVCVECGCAWVGGCMWVGGYLCLYGWVCVGVDGWVRVRVPMRLCVCSCACVCACGLGVRIDGKSVCRRRCAPVRIDSPKLPSLFLSL